MYKVLIGFWLIGLCFFQSYAQQQTKINAALIANYFQSVKDISTKYEDTKLNSINNFYDNYVIIQQVGFKNTVESKGNKYDSQTINQIGDKNQYNFFNYYNKAKSEFNINQQGNSNSLQIYGENSIIKKLGVLQKSNFKTIIIKNY